MMPIPDVNIGLWSCYKLLQNRCQADVPIA